MDDLLDMLMIRDLDGDSLNLAEVIGIEAFRNIVKVYGGSAIYIPKKDGLILPLRNELIIREYNGGNAYLLARKWGLTERRIQEIAKGKSAELREKTIDGQTTLF